MGSIPIALQLYSVHKECAEDLPGVLARVADMGYDGVEFAGYHGHNADDLKGLLDKHGLRCAGTHVKLQALLDDAFEETVEFNKAVGNRFLIVPAMPQEYRETLEGWSRAAELFTGLAERAAAADMRVGYHNHSFEFTPQEGTCPWDVFFSRVPDNVVMQLDTGNAREAGVEVAPFIERYPGRATTVHLKEWTDDPQGAVVGEGKVSWKNIFGLCESVGGTEWYIVEQEVYPVPPMEAAKKCLENLRRMGK